MRTLPRLRFFKGRGRSPVLGFAVLLCAAWAYSSHAWDAGYDLAVQADGKFVVVGTGAEGEVALARYQPDGQLDGQFGEGGKVLTRFSNGFGRAVGVAIQADGKIVVVGTIVVERGNSDIVVARYHPDGSLDEGFGGNGSATFDIAGGFDSASDVAIQDDGKILIVGTAILSQFNRDFVIVRLNPNGNLDTDFGAGGVALAGGSSLGQKAATGVVVQPDGKILVAGSSGSGITTQSLTPSVPGVFPRGAFFPSFRGPVFSLARFDPDGNLDPGFGNGGCVETLIAGGAGIECLRLLPDGKIIVSGLRFTTFALARYHSDGSLDDTFGSGGLIIDSRPDRFIVGGCLAVQPDGKIVQVRGDSPTARPAVVGYISPGFDFELVRFLPDGEKDENFTDDPVDFFAVSDPPVAQFGDHPSRTSDIASAIETLPNGEILVAGLSRLDFAVAKFKTDGALDPEFGTGGLVLTDFDRYQPDNRIRARGQRWIGGDVYDPSGVGQNIRIVNRQGKTGRFVFFVENDGTAQDVVKVRASRQRRGLRVRYFHVNYLNIFQQPGPFFTLPMPYPAKNVTAELTTLGLELPLSHGRPRVGRFEGKIRSRNGRAKIATLEIDSGSSKDTRKSDRARALAILGR